MSSKKTASTAPKTNKPRSSKPPVVDTPTPITEKFVFTMPVTITRNGRVSMTRLAEELTQFLASDLSDIAKDIGITGIQNHRVGRARFERVLPKKVNMTAASSSTTPRA